MNRHTVKIGPPPNVKEGSLYAGGRVELDGEDISNMVRSAKFEVGAHLIPTVELTVGVAALANLTARIAVQADIDDTKKGLLGRLLTVALKESDGDNSRAAVRFCELLIEEVGQ